MEGLAGLFDQITPWAARQEIVTARLRRHMANHGRGRTLRETHGSSTAAHAARCPCPRLTAQGRLQHAYRQRAAVRPALARYLWIRVPGTRRPGVVQWSRNRARVLPGCRLRRA